MREIKFRAWDGSEMSYRAFGAKINPPVQEFGIDFPASYSPYWTTGNMLALMQFTGVKDKNGREIYEGDIIECEYYEGLPSTKGLDSLVWRGVVEWRCDASFSVRRIGADNGWYSVSYGGSAIKRWEVAGNICENPELLPR